MRIAIVAFGDARRGDDAIGIEVISRLDRAALDEDVAIINGGTDVLRTLETVSGFDGLIVVDAASMGEPPGTVKAFDLNESMLDQSIPAITLRGMKMDTELLFASKFLNLPPTMIIGIQPGTMSEAGVSQTLASNMEQYVSVVTHAVSRMSSSRGSGL